MDQIGSLLDRPKLYYNIDGVGELGCGFMGQAYALLQWMQVHSPQGSAWHSMWLLFLYVGLMSTIIHFGSKAIKKHITYPRTGFVEYRASETVWRPAIIAGVVSALASVGLYFAIRKHWALTTPASLIGLLMAASYARGFAKTVRWKWVVAGALAAGSVAIAILPADLVGAVANDTWITSSIPPKIVGAFLLTFLLYGTVLMISGGISFWLYLRHTGQPAQEAE